jgi:hypothetical protein
MPSHIYTRVGYWKESIDSNTASVKAAKAEKSVGNYLHAQDYMVYAHLQLGQDKQANAVINEMMKESDFKATVMAAHYALAASPARYAVGARDRARVAAPVRQAPSACNGDLALPGAGRRRPASRMPHGRHRQARRAAHKLREARTPIGLIVDIQRQVAAAWAAPEGNTTRR